MRSLIGAFGRRSEPRDTPVSHTYRHAVNGGVTALSPGGTESYLRAMGRTGILFAIAGGLAQDVSQVGWHLYRKPRAPGGEREEVLSHAAIDLWDKPNPFMPRQEFVETFQQHAELVGEAWWVLYKRGDLPLEIWPVRPDRMAAVPHPTKFLTGYIYHSPGGEQVPLKLDEVIQIRQPDPVDIYRGMGAVQTVLPNLETDRMSAEWMKNFFLNSAQPGGLIRVDRRLSDDEFDEMRLRWEEQHRGVARAHRVAILEQAEWVDRKYSMRDMEFSENTKVNDDKIRQAYRYPVPLLGTVEAVNLANNLAQQEAYARYLLGIRLSRIKGALNHDLLPMYGNTSVGLEWDHDNPVPEDEAAKNAERDSKVAAAGALIGAGFDPEDVLKVLELPPMRIRVAAAPEPATATAVGNEPEHQKPALTAVRAERVLATVGRPTAALAAAAHVPNGHHHNGHGRQSHSTHVRDADDDGDGEPDLSGILKDVTQRQEQLERDWQPVLAKQIDSLVDQVKDVVQAGDPKALADIKVPEDLEGRDVLKRALDAMTTTAVRRAASEVAKQDAAIDEDQAEEDASAAAETAAVAAAVAAGLALALALSALDQALRLWSPGSPEPLAADEVADGVREHLETLRAPERSLKFGGTLHRVVNIARLVVQSAAVTVRPGGRLVASEILDRATCDRCEDINGTVYPTVLAAWRDYGTGIYRLCKGRWRCRGTTRVAWPGRQP